MQKQGLSTKNYTIATAAVGSEPEALAISNKMLVHVENKLESDRVNISGQRFTSFHSKAAKEYVWKYGREVNTDGVAVLQFEPGATKEKGQVSVWTATPFDPVASKPALIEAVDSGNLSQEQISRIAAVIEQAASHGVEVALELYIYTSPPGSLFTVGESPSQSTDDKGFGHWIGTQEEGALTLAAAHEPDYEPSVRQIEVKRGSDQNIVRENIKFILKRRPKRK